MSRLHRLYFNRMAPVWANKSRHEQMAEAVRGFVNKGENVLDAGAGTGYLTGKLCEWCDPGIVMAIDLSEKMLQEARKRITQKRVLFLCSDVSCTAVASNAFDKIVCYSSFPHFDRPIEALQEFLRMLKPGGKILVFHNCCSRRLNQFHAALPEVVSFDKLPKAEQLMELVRFVGFTNVVGRERPDLYWVEAQKPI
ncbi:MAG: class I SAM-dependent methyltransferase [candidate division KSB1 bacterium]|nr:class I SAM-dependent methyltransferase [candidate division KSB1 bacterium]